MARQEETDLQAFLLHKKGVRHSTSAISKGEDAEMNLEE